MSHLCSTTNAKTPCKDIYHDSSSLRKSSAAFFELGFTVRFRRSAPSVGIDETAAGSGARFGREGGAGESSRGHRTLEGTAGAQDVERELEELDGLTNVLVGVGLGVLFLGFSVGAMLVTRAMRPIKVLVEAHGGSLDCQSEFGAGATFTVHLPTGPTIGPRANLSG